MIKPNESFYVAADFSPDNCWLDLRGEEETKQLSVSWVDNLIQIARRATGRNLSTNEWNSIFPDQSYFEVFPGLPIPKN